MESTVTNMTTYISVDNSRHNSFMKVVATIIIMLLCGVSLREVLQPLT